MPPLIHNSGRGEQALVPPVSTRWVDALVSSADPCNYGHLATLHSVDRTPAWTSLTPDNRLHTHQGTFRRHSSSFNGSGATVGAHIQFPAQAPSATARLSNQLQRWLVSSFALTSVSAGALLDAPAAKDESPWDDDSEDEHDPFILLLTLLILFGTLFVIIVVFSITIALFRRSDSLRLSDDELCVDVQQDDDDEEQVASREEGYVEGLLANDQAAVANGYLRSKQWVTQHPLGSVPTDITLVQSLAIQEKGVSAWSFEPNYEDNPSVLVSARTELCFLPDGVGMAPEEGGAACVQSNLPVPRSSSLCYFEVKMFNLPAQTEVAIGLAPKPYPHFRFPGLERLSVGYLSDGTKCHNHPWNRISYGHTFSQGDVVGVGYHPRGGQVYFTHNGRRLKDAFCGLSWGNFFPAIAANGPAEIHINFGQAGFVFIEANVRRLGFAPMLGTLPPPPPYGVVRGSVLIESGDGPVIPDRNADNVASSSTQNGSSRI